jgi:4-alpha-glucanotransferase
MDALHKQIHTLQASAFQKYFELLSQDTMLHEYIRWQNIGGLFSVWAMFERFILRQHGQISRKHPGYIERVAKLL